MQHEEYVNNIVITWHDDRWLLHSLWQAFVMYINIESLYCTSETIIMSAIHQFKK